MEFLKKVGSTAESLLEQVDQKTAEISKDVRSGNLAARRAAERLEKRERIVINSESNIADPELVKKLERMQADLDAAGEVLNRSQQLAAEREGRLTTQLEKERLERDKREEELMTRIRQLEAEEKRRIELEQLTEQLSIELEEARGGKDEDTVELQAQAEAARADAEHARASLAAAIKDSEARTAALERTNLELVRELGQLKLGREGGAAGQSEAFNALDEERQKRLKETQDLEDRLIASEDRRSALEMQLSAEKARTDRLETELSRITGSASTVREEHAKQLREAEEKVAAARREADEARVQLESLQRANQDNGRDALEKRLASLSSHLELKQRQIDTLRSEKSALEQRFNDPLTFQGIRARLPVTTSADPKPLKLARLRIDPLKHRKLARAVDVMDRLTLSAGAIMRSEPLVRLGFLAYILLLHIWVFHVISWTSTPVAAPAAAFPGSISVAAAIQPGQSLRGAAAND